AGPRRRVEGWGSACQCGRERAARPRSGGPGSFVVFLHAAAVVKLKDPVITVSLSMPMSLLWAIAWAPSIRVAMPAWARKSAEEYFAPVSRRSRITWTSTPRAWARARALAMGAEVKE